MSSTSSRRAIIVVGREVLGLDEVGDVGSGIAHDRVLVDVVAENSGYLRRDGNKIHDIPCSHGVIQRVRRRHRADEDEHDQAHALLSVVRAVAKTDTGAGKHQQSANEERRRLFTFWRLKQGLDLELIS